MFKAIILLSKKESASAEDFAQWWLHDHAPLAKQLPGLRKAVFNRVINDAGYDGVSELWFDDQSAFEDAYASEIGQQVANDSIENVGKRERLFIEEHELV